MAEKQREKHGFLSGVLLLSASTVLVKITGLLWKIPMLTLLGSVGMGYFQSAFELFALFCILCTAGLPVALSVLISSALAKGREQEVPRIFSASLWIFLLIGTAGTAVMLGLSQAFCNLLQSENAKPCIQAISPTVLLVCLSAALRGYFQGYRRMFPTAFSQLLEALGKLVFGLLFANAALKRGYQTPQVAAAAGWGLTAGALLSFLYLLWELLRFAPKAKATEEKSQTTYREVWKKLSALAIPMTLGAFAASLVRITDMTMILRRLRSIGYSELAANEAYGNYSTLAQSVFALVPTLVNSVALPLVPLLSAAVAEENRERQKENSSKPITD